MRIGIISTLTVLLRVLYDNGPTSPILILTALTSTHSPALVLSPYRPLYSYLKLPNPTFLQVLIISPIMEKVGFGRLRYTMMDTKTLLQL